MHIFAVVCRAWVNTTSALSASNY